MATSTPLQVSPDSQKEILKHSETLFSMVQFNFNFRSRLLEQDRLYYRELDWSQAQKRADTANRTGDSSKMQNVTVPVVGPQVDSATAYFVEMFLTSYPIFPVVARPELADVALQIETVMGQSAIHHQWGRHLALCFRDNLKHNICAMEVDWKVEKIPQVYTDVTENVATGSIRETMFAGNKLKHVNLYNLIFDPRVLPCEIHTRGEFVGYTELITRTELKQMFLDLDTTLTMNATKAFESGTAATTTEISQQGTYYVPQVNPQAFLTPNFTAHNWMTWAGMDTKKKIRYSDMYEVTTLYCRIIPKEFGIFARIGRKNPGDPQIYKFIIVNRKVVIFVQRMTNAHNMLPIIVGQLNEDGLGLQTKSYADNAAPYQFLSSALYNSALQSQRRKVYDRIIYDPSRINKSDIDKPDPIARIPVKTEAYGRPVTEAFAQVPYRDEGIGGILEIARQVVDMADVSTGQNRVTRGQFQKGNKTRYEFDTVMNNSDARPRTSAILMGIQWLQPIKDILKYNILQYQPPAELFNQDQMKPVKIEPAKIREIAWEFQMADGIMPSDKYLNFELFGQAFQYAAAVPQVAMEWDIMGMMAYQLKMQGARWVNNFRRTPAQMAQLPQPAETGAPQ